MNDQQHTELMQTQRETLRELGEIRRVLSAFSEAFGNAVDVIDRKIDAMGATLEEIAAGGDGSVPPPGGGT